MTGSMNNGILYFVVKLALYVVHTHTTVCFYRSIHDTKLRR